MASGLESDVEDNDSETELKEPPEPVITELSYDATIDKNLPDTVTLLTTPEGSKVYLVGTAHFSKESQEDVAKARWAFIIILMCILNYEGFYIFFFYRLFEQSSHTLF